MNYIEKREIGRKKLAKLLHAHEIEMKIYGCGCCGSPTVTVKHKGEIIVDDLYDFTFNSNELKDKIA